MKHTIHYVHSPATHNTRAAEAFLPILVEKIGLPESVVDVGCGTGTWLRVFKDLDVKRILGIDGDNVDLDQLHIDRSEFKIANLTLPVELKERFGLAVCLEVAEHLPETASETLIDSLCSLADTVLFSAALPQQGGQNHINEQYFDYWQKKFNQRGYFFEDTFRSMIWKDERIDSWYRQNMFLAKKAGGNPVFQKPVNSYYHPKIFHFRVVKYQRMLDAKTRLANGNIGIASAFKILAKAIVNSIFSRKSTHSPTGRKAKFE